MLIPIIGLIAGVAVGIYCPYVFPGEYSGYVAIGILACADSVLGGAKSNLYENFSLPVFLSGFVGNAVIATVMVFLGEQLNIQLSIAAVVVFGSRIFQNFADMRRFWLNIPQKRDKI